jgi:hypothetical protein
MKLSINDTVNTIFDKFDHNKNNSIEYKKDEYKYVEVNKRTEKEDEDDLFGNDEYKLEVHSWNNFFEKVDTNKDGSVTKEETKNLVSKYDKNNDGKLETSLVGLFFNSKKEGNQFQKDFPTTVLKESRWSSFKPDQNTLKEFLGK